MSSIASTLLNHYNTGEPIPTPSKPKRKSTAPAMTEELLNQKTSMLNALKIGLWVVEFRKVDGSMTTMECTLDPKFLPNDSKAINPVRSNVDAAEHLIHAYSIDRVGWRSFVVPNVQKFYKKPESI